MVLVEVWYFCISSFLISNIPIYIISKNSDYHVNSIDHCWLQLTNVWILSCIYKAIGKICIGRKRKQKRKLFSCCVMYSCYWYLWQNFLCLIYNKYINIQNFFLHHHYNCRIWLLQIEAGLVKKQYIAKVVGEFPEDEVFYLASDELLY